MERRFARMFFGVAALALATAVMFALPAPHAQAAINPQINFQGKLTNPDGTNVADGNYSIRFRIYNDPSADAANTCSANSCLWEETQGTVAVSAGLFRVALGSGTTLPGNVDFNTSGLYLGIKVGSDPEMTPRIQFTASPYAFNAAKLNGLDSTSFVQLAQGVQTDASTANPSIFINKTNASGTPNILQLQKAGADVLTIGNTGAALFKNSSDGTTAFRIQNQNGNNYLLVNTSGASVSLGDTGIASTVQIGNTSGAVSQTLNLGTNATSSGTNIIHIGDAATATNTITIGSSSNTTNTLALESGTGTTNLFNGATAHTIQFATGGAVQTVTIGSTNTSSTTSIVGGASGSVNIGSVGTSTVASTTNIATTSNGTGAQAVTIGSNANTNNAVAIDAGDTGQVKIGNSASAHTIAIGGTGANNQTVNIGNGVTGASNTSVVAIGSNNAAASTVTIQGGNGTGAISIQSAASGTIGIGTAGVANTVTIGNTSGAVSQTLNLGTNATSGGTNVVHIGDSTTATNTITIGSSSNTANSLALESGTGTTNLFNGATAHTIQFATGGAVQTLSIGSTNSSSSTDINAGSGDLVLNATGGAVTLQTTTSGAINIKPASVDGTNVNIGTSDTVGTQLVLDTKTGAGDPATGVNGGMYYNSNSNTFRCYENSVWYDCLSRHKIVMPNDVADSTTNCTFTAATGLSFAVVSGQNYRFHANINYTSAATGTGIGLSATGPATPTQFSTMAMLPIASTSNPPASTNIAAAVANTYDGGGCSASTPSTGAAGWQATLEGFIRPSANGTLQIDFATEVNNSAVTIKAGSTLEWW